MPSKPGMGSCFVVEPVAMTNLPAVLLPEQAEHLRSDLPVRIVIGTVDGLWNGNQLFHQLMLDHDYYHDFVVVPDAGHNLTTLFDAVGLEGISFHVRANGWQ